MSFQYLKCRLNRILGTPAKVLCVLCGLVFWTSYVYIQTDSSESLQTDSSESQNNDSEEFVDDYVSFDSFDGFEQTDPKLVAYVKTIIEPPSPANVPYNLKNPNAKAFSQFGQDAHVKKLLNNMKNGFFIELGAANGEQLSNTLMLERDLGWTGLLIEPTNKFYTAILSKNRKAHKINACASLDTKATTTYFFPNNYIGRIAEKSKETVVIKAIPLYTMLLALNVFQIDFFSLDVEGHEMKILTSIPWDKIKIRLMCIEINHVPGGAPAVIKFMVGQGYKHLGNIDIDAWFGHPELMEIKD